MKNVQRHRGTSEKWRKYPLIPTVAVSTEGRVKNSITGRIYALDKNNHGRDTGNVSLRLRLKDANGIIKHIEAHPRAIYAVLLAVLFLISVLHLAQPSMFLYFQF